MSDERRAARIRSATEPIPRVASPLRASLAVTFGRPRPADQVLVRPRYPPRLDHPAPEDPLASTAVRASLAVTSGRPRPADHPRHPAGLDHAAPKDPLRFVLVVRAAEHPDTLHARLAPSGHGQHVVELEEAGLLASPAVLGDERTARSIPRRDPPPHLARHVPARTARPAFAPRLR